MPQFDIYINPHQKTRAIDSFIINLQNDLLDNLATRIVAPIAPYNQFNSQIIDKLTPLVLHKEHELLILMPQISSMPERLLNSPIGSLSHLRDEIIVALNFAI